jgi:hypothetical protein
MDFFRGKQAAKKAVPLMGLEKYPEFGPLVSKLERQVIANINAEARLIESKMPYKVQFVLEELISRLKEHV